MQISSMNVLKKNKENLKPANKVNADILAPRLVFIISVLILILFGLVMVFSASSVEALNNDEASYSYLLKQLMFCVVGIIAAVLIWRVVPFEVWKGNFTWICFAVLFAIMIVTLFGGTDILGARRWIYIGPISLQPSEFAKIALVVLVGKLYSEMYTGKIPVFKFLVSCGLSSASMLFFIVVGQSDLGTTIICIIGIIAALWMAYAPKWLVGGLLALTFIVAALFIVSSGYRSNRFAYIDPYNDGQDGYGAGYQIIRSYYAFAEGGIKGVGLGNSYEKYQYLPEAETDFIFAIIGEELGLIGAIFVLLLYAVFIISGLMIAKSSKNCFGSSVAGAFVIMIAFQAIVNIFCVIGIFPTTGKPLPFISSGGSSLIASLVMVGFVLAASEDDSKPDIYEKRRSSFKAINVKGILNAPLSVAATVAAGADKIRNTAYEISEQNIKNERARKSSKAQESNKSLAKLTNKTKNIQLQKTISKTNNDQRKIREPKFIATNIKSRNNSKKIKDNISKKINKKSKDIHNRNIQRKTSRPSVSFTNNNSKCKTNSYAYRRRNNVASFKPNNNTRPSVQNNIDSKKSSFQKNVSRNNINSRRYKDYRKK